MKFEYITEYINAVALSTAAYTNRMNELGEEGWSLIAITSGNWAVFQREKVDRAPQDEPAQESDTPTPKLRKKSTAHDATS